MIDIAPDAAGNVNMATLMHGGINVAPPVGGSAHLVSMPDDYTINICFGGPGMRTAYITLSGCGTPIAAPWDRSGLRLNFAA